MSSQLLAVEPSINVYSTGGNRTQQVYNIDVDPASGEKQIAELLLIYEDHILQLSSRILDTITNQDVSGLSPYKPSSLILNSSDTGLTGMDSGTDIGKSSSTLNAQFIQLGSLTSDIVKSQAMIRFGTLTSTDNINTVAEGFSSIATGFAAHAAGIYNLSGGTGSFVEGTNNSTDQIFAHLDGGNNQALPGISGTTQYYQHLEGLNNLSYGQITHTENLSNVNLGDSCHTHGITNMTTSLNCHAHGQLTISGNGSMVSEVYNVIQPDYTQFVLTPNSNTDNLNQSFVRTNNQIIPMPSGAALVDVPYTKYSVSFLYQPFTQNNVNILPIQTLSSAVSISFTNSTSKPTYTLTNVSSKDRSVLRQLLNASNYNQNVYFVDTVSNYYFAVYYSKSLGNLTNPQQTTWVFSSVTATDINPTANLTDLLYGQSIVNEGSDDSSYFTPIWGTTMIEYANQVFVPSTLNIFDNLSPNNPFIVFDSTINLYGGIGTLVSVSPTEPSTSYGPAQNINIEYPYCLSNGNTVPNQSLVQAQVITLVYEGGFEMPTILNSVNIHRVSSDLGNTHAEGFNTTAIGANSHADGSTNLSLGDNSHTEGYQNIAIGTDAHAEGIKTVACGLASHSEGAFTKAEGESTHAEGFGTTSGLASAHAEGQYNFAAGIATHAEGSNNTASGTNAHAEGYNCTVSADNSHADGYQNTVQGSATGAHVDGVSNTVSGSGTHIDGNTNLDTGTYDHCDGTGQYITGYGCHTEGIQNSNSGGTGLHFEGYQNFLEDGQNSHLEGDSNQLFNSITSCHIEGYSHYLYTNITYVHLEGSSNNVFGGNGAHIEGYNNSCYSSNYGVHLEGFSNFANASCIYSHSEGSNISASGTGTHSEGSLHSVDGYFNHIEGLSHGCGGTANHLEGYDNNVNTQYCHVSGQYSTVLADNLFVWNDGQAGNINYSTPYTFNVHATNGAFFSNNMSLGGGLYVVGTKNFRIDHPLDLTKELVHFCIESNEVLNIYKGTVRCDNHGEAVVRLPEYVAALNINYTYQATAIGAPCAVYIKSEMKDHQFVIAGGQPDVRIDWILIGVRNDPYFKDHPERRSVEVDKF